MKPTKPNDEGMLVLHDIIAIIDDQVIKTDGRRNCKCDADRPNYAENMERKVT